jgi:hypothetical protein
MSGFRAAIIGSCISALWFVAAPADAANGAGARRMTVAVCDLEAVPSQLMILAQQVATDVYRDIGIELDWVNNECDADRRVLTVSIRSRNMADMDVSDYTLGFAESGTRAATVLYDRVDAFAHRYRIKCEVLLGYVIAHELGHLLLPPKSHSAAGVMSATINLEMASARRLRFTFEQGALIRVKLGGTPGYTAAVRPQNCCDARRAPSAMAASLPQTTSGSTAAWPTQVP